MNTCLICIAVVAILIVAYIIYMTPKNKCHCTKRPAIVIRPKLFENLTVSNEQPKNVEQFTRKTKPRESFTSTNCYENLNDHINKEVSEYVVPGGSFECANGENIQGRINKEIYSYYGNMYSNELEQTEASQFNELRKETMANYNKDSFPSMIDTINNSVSSYYLPMENAQKKSF